jgi:hypothetical protein
VLPWLVVTWPPSPTSCVHHSSVKHTRIKTFSCTSRNCLRLQGSLHPFFVFRIVALFPWLNHATLDVPSGIIASVKLSGHCWGLTICQRHFVVESRVLLRAAHSVYTVYSTTCTSTFGISRLSIARCLSQLGQKGCTGEVGSSSSKTVV